MTANRISAGSTYCESEVVQVQHGALTARGQVNKKTTIGKHNGKSSPSKLPIFSSPLLARLAGNGPACSAQVLFRVLVSDGIHTAYDEFNNTFTVPNRIPAVTILEPVNGQTFVIDQTVGLRGRTYDIDTGTMDAKLLEWSSNKDGSLDSG